MDQSSGGAPLADARGSASAPNGTATVRERSKSVVIRTRSERSTD
jgi:hypothetical protein